MSLWLITSNRRLHFFPVSAKNRGIAIPSDLDMQVNAMFEKSQLIKKTTQKWQIQSKKRESISVMTRSGENKNIIEGLQVCSNLKSFYP